MKQIECTLIHRNCFVIHFLGLYHKALNPIGEMGVSTSWNKVTVQF